MRYEQNLNPIFAKARAEAGNLLIQRAMNVSPQFSLPELAVVMPMYNEAANITLVLRDWFACLEQVVPNFVFFAINDGSNDETATTLAVIGSELGPRLRVVNKKNSGHGRSCREGYERALAEGAAWILQIDSDGQCDPVFFPAFYKDRQSHDCIFGQRRTRDDGFGRVVISRCCSLLLWLTTGMNLKDANVPYRLMRAKSLRNALKSVPACFDLQNIALSVALKSERQLRWKYLPIHFRARQGGKNSINYYKIATMGLIFLRDLRPINTNEDSHTWWRPRWARRRLAS